MIENKIKSEYCFGFRGNGRQRGIALLLTIVILVAMAGLVYSLGVRLSERKRRDQYIIDYQNARYAADSAMKYALVMVENLDTSIEARPNEPDFSDLFHMSEEEYELMKAEWMALYDPNDVNDANKPFVVEKQEDNVSFRQLLKMAGVQRQEDVNDPNYVYDANDPNDPNYSADGEYFSSFGDMNDSDVNYVPEFVVRGPYGPRWPHVIEPMEFEMGNAVVTIEIHDENAKLPLSWSILSDKDEKVERLADIAVTTFFEWMSVPYPQIEEVKNELKEVKEIKQFKMNMKPVVKTTVKKEKVTTRSRRRSRRSRRSRTRYRTKRITKTRPAELHTNDFAKLMTTSAENLELLNVPYLVAGDRVEYPLKYTGIWGSEKVNINTAPRHVLEAVFSFGGDAPYIAHEIIELRREKPIESVEKLKEDLFGFTNSIEKAEPYITTRSEFFTLRVTANSGNAHASAIAAVIKQDGGVKKVAMQSE